MMLYFDDNISRGTCWDWGGVTVSSPLPVAGSTAALKPLPVASLV